MKKAVLLILISLVVFTEASIPFFFAEKKCLPQNQFLGQIATTDDQNMYFSFIEQADKGSLIFNNKLTYVHNAPAFINFEFWLVGFIERCTGMSENAVFYFWRYLGALFITTGFFFLARLILPEKRVFACLLMFLLTGGFGFIFAILNSLHLISHSAALLGMVDITHIHFPFGQIICNPHFAFPHGIILMSYALFLYGEKTGKFKYYLASGILFFLTGLVRPYDTIPPFIVFPLYILVTNKFLKYDFKQVMIQLLPVFMSIPVLIYNLWLFKYNEIFKYWSLQGHNAYGLPPILWHYFTFGIIGILAIVRLLQVRTNPLSKFEKFLVVWFFPTFLFSRLGILLPKLIGWSPQIGTYLVAPLVLLAFSIKTDAFVKKKAMYYTAISLIVLLVVAGNISSIVFFCWDINNKAKVNNFYANKNEVAAWRWLDGNMEKGSVVLAALVTSQRIAKYTTASVVAAHYSVTPHFDENKKYIDEIYNDSTVGERQKTLLRQLDVSYVYVGPLERKMHDIKVEQGSFLTLVYSNQDVSVYRVNTNN